MFERRLFGKTDDEILRALEFYDKHSEQAVQDDMTREEARKQVFNKVKNWEGSECHNFVLGLEALGLLKLKKEPEGTTDFICVSSVMKNDTLKTVYINHALINYIGDKLQEKCRAIFGTSWSNDIARVFARIAITEYELQKAKDNK